MKNYFKILPILFLSLFIISCGDDNDNDGVCCAGSSIVDLASQTESLSTLVSFEFTNKRYVFNENAFNNLGFFRSINM